MKDGIINIDLDKDLVTLFVHKPYDFKIDKISEEEKNKEYKDIEELVNYKINIVRTKQTHSNNVKVINESNKNDSFENVDGLITNLKDVTLVTYIADCQGIILYDQNKKVIGNIHSGWKGTLTRISTNAINLMIKEFNSNVSDIKVYISPSIHKCCFEVDEDLMVRFKNEFKDIDLTNIITKGEVKEGKQKIFYRYS